jgi:hypothetical protein
VVSFRLWFLGTAGPPVSWLVYPTDKLHVHTKLVHAVRRRHQDVSGALAEQFVRAWRAEGFAARGHIRQTEIFEHYVAPETAHLRTAYVLVDALRWELARELPEVLGGDFETRMELAIGTAPSITDVGMAALLPSASSGLHIGGTAKIQRRHVPTTKLPRGTSARSLG